MPKKSSQKGGDYEKGFEHAPESLQEDDDEEDDIGKPIIKNNGGAGGKNKNKSNLNFDSDEDKDENELITLDKEAGTRDRTNTAAEKIPKLSKP